VPPHPQHHVGDHHHGDQAHHGLEAFLLSLGEVVRDDLERHADADADQDGNRDPDPDLPERRPATLLTQEGGHDAHDEGSVHSFPEAYDESR
jgi:hypothetical protein